MTQPQPDGTAEPSSPPAHGPIPYPPPPAAFAAPPPPSYPPPPASYSPPPVAYSPPPPGYAPPSAGGPHPGTPYAPGRMPGTNTLAVVALVLAFVLPLAAVVCGHIARKQIRQTGQEGGGFATAALIIGYAWIALSLLVGCFVAVILVNQS